MAYRVRSSYLPIAPPERPDRSDLGRVAAAVAEIRQALSSLDTPEQLMILDAFQQEAREVQRW